MAKRTRKSARPADEPSPLLERLKEIAVASGLEVREERLLREVGYSVRSGVCKVSDQEVLLLDRNATPAERIEVLCSLLAERDLDSVFIEPELRRTIGGRAMCPGDGASSLGRPEGPTSLGPSEGTAAETA
jgi:hypothetical protein